MQRTEELIISNCGAGEDSRDSLGKQEDQLIIKGINPDYSF